MSIDKETLDKLLDTLHDDAFCPSCHHGEGIEIPNAAAVIQEAFKLGVASVNPVPAVTPCDSHTCDYYRHYLAHGPVELTHESYHGAYKTCLAWQERAESYYQNDKPIPVYIESQCRKWERKIRS